MNSLTNLHIQDATWRSGVARARKHLGSTVNVFGMTAAYGTKPAAIPATAPTRRGAPPH